MSSEIQQLLYGYSDGHRLLAASRRPPRDAERALLILTDISGPVTAGAFESYLTGCPVPGTGAYALARTWLATELNRPGCVWTHTLLIEQGDLGRIPQLALLRSLFRRPRRGESWQAYATPLPVPAAGPPSAAETRPAWAERDAARVLAALYGLPDAPTFLVADRADTLEELVLALWSQQWPALRGALRFCTWSLAVRAIDGQLFDFQVVPPSVGRQLGAAQARGTMVNLTARAGSGTESAVPGWAREAARDLGQPDGPWRRLLWRVGGDMPARRSAFAPLAEVGSQVELIGAGRLTLAELLTSVASRFRLPGDAKALKAALFGERSEGEPALVPSVREADLLREVATTGLHAALDAGDLAVRRRAMALWKTAPAEALGVAQEVVAAGPVTPPGAQLLDGIAHAIGATEAAAIRSRHPALFGELERRNPSLAAAAAPVAPVPVEPRRETPTVVAPPPRPLEPRPATPLVMGPPPRPAEPRPTTPLVMGPPPRLPAPLPGAVREPARVAPQAPAPQLPRRPVTDTVAGILDRLDRSDGAADLGADWRKMLKTRTPEVVTWFLRAKAPAPRAVAAVADALDPHSPAVRRIGAEPWLRTTQGVDVGLERREYLKLAAFLLSVAFDNPGPGAEELVARVFEPVDTAARRGELTPEAWDLLADQLPPLPWWRERDWSERLRRGLVERFVRHDWPPEQLLRAVRDDATFERVVVICEWTRQGESLLRRLAAKVTRGATDATGPQRALLARYA